MRQIVFYSWQSDLPNSCNRGFIQSALEGAAKAIAADQSVEIEPVVDRDTQGVPGSPDIASTIFSKITAADVFVADVSIVGRSEGRALPNPNVLIELGYALKALGQERIMLLFNREFGEIQELPFDVRMRRVLVYEVKAEAKEKAQERKLLERQLEGALRTALEHRRVTAEEPVSIAAVDAIENQQPNRTMVLRRNLEAIFQAFASTEPRKAIDGGTAQELIAALAATQEAVAQFSKISETSVVMDDWVALSEIHRWLGLILERYDNPRGFSGHFSNADHDYFKFLGHELFVTVVALLLREQRWEHLSRLLAEPIPVRYLARRDGPGLVDWSYASDHLPSLLDEGSRRRRVCLQADIIKERHTTGELVAIVSMDDFVAADYFLFLFGDLRPSNPNDVILEWRPWSALYLQGAPTFLRHAERRHYATKLIETLGLPTIEEFKKRYFERAPRLRQLFSSGAWHDWIAREDIERIGTQ